MNRPVAPTGSGFPLAGGNAGACVAIRCGFRNLTVVPEFAPRPMEPIY